MSQHKGESLWTKDISSHIVSTLAVLGLVVSSLVTTALVADVSANTLIAFNTQYSQSASNILAVSANGAAHASANSQAAASAPAVTSATPVADTTTTTKATKADTAKTVTTADATTDTPTIPAAASTQAKYATGQILVKFKDGTTQGNQDAALKSNSASVKSTIPHIGVSLIKVPAGAEEKVAAALAHNPNVTFAEVDSFAYPLVIPNDTYYPQQWNLTDIHTSGGWDLTTGSSNVTIAVLGDGIDAAHADLAANMVPGWNAVSNNTNNMYYPTCPHETNVAGAADAIGNNTIGVAGVAWGAKLMPIVMITDATCVGSWSAMANGITWAADHGAKVINISWGGSSYSAALQTAITYAWGKGLVVVVASGNEAEKGNPVGYPAAMNNVVAVGATGPTGYPAPFSSYGSYVTVAAPGVSIRSTDNSGSAGYASTDYDVVAGTSFSSPQVAGLAALVFSINPALTNQQVVDLIKNNADDYGTQGFDPYYGYGHINVARTLYAAAGRSMPADTSVPTKLAIAGFANNANYVVGKTILYPNASDDVGVTKLELFKDSVLMSSAPMGSTVTWDASLDADGSTHAIMLKAYDAAGNVGTLTSTITVDKSAPTATFAAPQSGATVSGTIALSATVTDNVGVGYVCFFIDSTNASPYCPAGVASVLNASKVSTNTYNASWNTSSLTLGTHTVRIYAYDLAGNASSNSITVTVGNGTTPPTDTTAPSVPTGLTGSAVSSSQINLAWSASTDATGVTGYKIYRNGTQVGTSVGTTFSDSNLVANTAYTYAVSAYDAAGNTSAQSTGVAVTTKVAADTQAPVTTITSPITGATISGSTAVNASASDNIGVTKVELYLDGSLYGTIVGSPYLFTLDTTKLTNGSHTLATKAYDAAGNTGSSAVIAVNVSNTVAVDTTAPVVTITSPANGAKLKTTGNTSLAASASDTSGIATMTISLDGKVLKTCSAVTTCSYALSNKGVATGSHTVTVTATDNSANHNVSTGSVSISK